MSVEKKDLMASISDSESDEEEENNELLRQNIHNLRQQIHGNNYYYDGHLSLISSLRQLGELEEARSARQAMSRVFPLTPELWMEWIADEQKIISSEDDRKFVFELFEKAVQDYTSVKLWVEFIMFMLGGGNHELTRQICERALTSVGTHVAEGILVWQVTQLFELQVHSELSNSADQSDDNKKRLTNQVSRIRSLFCRQVRVPLMNTDQLVLLQELSQWWGEDDDIKELERVKKDLQKSLLKLAERLPFEDKLIKIGVTQRLPIYRNYLKEIIVKEKSNPTAIQTLYERAITDNCLDIGLWEDYLSFVTQQFPGADYFILPLCQRSVRNCPWSGVLCETYIFNLEKYAANFGDVNSLIEKAKGVLNTCLSSGVTTGSEATRMWMAFLLLLRHQIKWEEPHEEQLDVFRKTCRQAQEAIDLAYGETGDLESEIPRLLSRIEAEFAKEIETSRTIWNDVILTRNDNFKNVNLWLEFIHLERSYGDEKHCRKLFRRALERVWDWVEMIISAFVRFEAETGTVETIQDCRKRCKDRLTVVERVRAETATKEKKTGDKFVRGKQQQTQEKVVKSLEKTDMKHQLKTSRQKDRPSGSSSHGFKEDIPPPSYKGSVSPPPGFKGNLSPPPGFHDKKRTSEERHDGPDAKKQKSDAPFTPRASHDPADDLRTVFISNLEYAVTTDQVVNSFTQCGPIETFRLVKDFKGRSKGFGYLVFESMDSCRKALALDRKVLMGQRPIFVSECDPVGHSHAFKYQFGPEKEKLFVRGLPFELNEQAVREAFEPHGVIKEMRLVTFRNGHSKGNCYITYHNAAAAQRVLEIMNGAEIKGKIISVMISDPSAPKTPRTDLSTPLMTAQPAFGQRGGRGGRLTLLPRALNRSVPHAVPKINAGSNGGTDPAPSGSAPPGGSKSNEDFRKMFK